MSISSHLLSQVSATHTNTCQADDELDSPYLAGFEWDREECYTRFVVHQAKQPTTSGGGSSSGGKKKKNKGGDE